ncbi:RING/FYVE/PHD zinc finger superfamily protein [Zea mays]|uniref:RING/FYVE/PHD zinc finger superfamily protein n=1 Tax=Zea mays TaxID=4577 RepID=A0A1D6JDZ8_MAIZE|nr:RING/FYVE/PHD zinc finger superfamily protein [Zea mays]
MAGDSSPSPASAPVQVRCAGCRSILAVGLGVTEFICPKCRMAQRLPPQLMAKSTSPSSPLPKAPSKPSLPPTQPRMGAPSAQGVDPTKIQLPCAGCQAVLNVPHGLARFRCPQCGVDLAVDHAKLQNFLAASNSATSSGHAPTSVRTQPPLATFLSVLPLQLVPGATISMVLPAAEPHEEINEVAIDVERDEDEGGTVGETFTDYRPSKLSLGLSHPDPVVETSSLSAVQPPEPTYCLNIMDELDETNALSCLQIETIVYACQVFSLVMGLALVRAEQLLG